MPPDPEAIARTVLAAQDTGARLDRFTDAPEGLDLVTAYRAGHALRRLREARGERVVGHKAGFTNKALWPAFGVDAPIFAPIYDTTAATTDRPVSAGRLLEPRIEPEIVLRIASLPKVGMDDAALMGCISHVAHGFEIVQSPFPGWHFAVPDLIVAAGLHAALRHGPFVEVRPEDHADWIVGFRTGRVKLLCNGHEVAQGSPRNVLDAGPLSVLACMAALMADQGAIGPLCPGEIISTGTMTDAFPVTPGETWQTAVQGLPLEGLSLTIAATFDTLSPRRGGSTF